MRRDILLVGLTVGGFVTAAAIVIALHGLPEEGASTFNALSQATLKTELKVLKSPTPSNNTYVYAISDSAAQAIGIALNDSQVKQMLSQARGSAITIAGVQPTEIEDKNGNIFGSSSGEVVITSNRQAIAGQPYTSAETFSAIAGKPIVARQQVWNVLIDMDHKQVSNIISDSNRTIYGNVEPNVIATAMNMFMPDIVNVGKDSNVIWNNNSELEHNVVGVYNTSSGKRIVVDSGIIPAKGTWEHRFNETGVFQYQCTIHSEEGMKGTIVVSSID
jgi:plastocyanin